MGKMMKNVLKKLVRDEEGQAFILVLIFLLVGGLIIAPLLGFMSTGLKVGQMHEAKMEGFYAADAGVEDALYKIMSDDASLPQNVGDDPLSYDLEDETGNPIYINGNSVQVEIVLEEDAEGFLDDLLEENYSGSHEDWQVVQNVIAEGTYTITITYSGNAQKEFITGVGAWFRGDYAYVAGSASGITDDYPDYEPLPFETQEYRGGTAFVWGWTGSDKPEFGTVSGVFTRTLTFEFTPVEIPSFYFSWAIANQASIGVVTSDATFGTYKVIATATATGEQTEVITYASREASAIVVLAWEINPQ